ncbi:sigma-70 family RNA polymerase sigma factor [Polyangium sp. y55x31]|uniref:RNA polymerase sigma factor n=1 Tax=Polyangium sp. y55x31 TaxID=3042688 RepID=UPI00248244AA|nr:sigma-70 family RNA polymerase sigma factor [Polyangium sp. y55x31]MDI1474987.1 sigma-70 family RNA polymerase sigma factor [Polyangium sp. y55x31]
MDEPRLAESLADPELRRFLLDFVRRRVSPADADDIVQTVLCEALTAKNRPGDGAELRKYLLGIARHKVADAHRRTAREEVRDPPELVASPPPVEEEALMRWAERQAPATEEAKKTLAWMAREGEGEKLESIAEEEQVPAARVRQRVSRMRRWMKERWLAELAAVAALAVLAVVLWRVAQDAEDPEEAILPLPDRVPAPSDTPLDRARALRADALWWCERGSYKICVDELDAAKQLDPTGDQAPEVQAARERARRALTTPPPVPTSTERDTKEKKGEIDEKAKEPQKIAPAPPKPVPTSEKPKLDPELQDRGTENEKAKPVPKQRKKGDVDFLKK